MLESWLRSKTIPQAVGMRARVVLLSAQGSSLRAIAQQLGLTERTVCLWRQPQQESLDGLRSRRRSGRPRSITGAKEFAVVTATMRRPPYATHWSARRLAKQMGVSFMTVHRIWRKYGLQPHRVETFKFSTDPEFDRRLSDRMVHDAEYYYPRDPYDMDDTWQPRGFVWTLEATKGGPVREWGRPPDLTARQEAVWPGLAHTLNPRTILIERPVEHPAIRG